MVRKHGYKLIEFVIQNYAYDTASWKNNGAKLKCYKIMKNVERSLVEKDKKILSTFENKSEDEKHEDSPVEKESESGRTSRTSLFDSDDN